MATTVKWGILGTGSIARKFARGVNESSSGELAAIGSRRDSSATEFAREFHIPAAHGSYEDLLANPEVEVVYISTPHPLHAEWAIKAAEAGKHILCEKPLTVNHPDAVTVAEAARRNGVFLMEAFMYRCHPQTSRVVELIRDGAIGDVRMIEASFGFRAEYNLGSRLLNHSLGGGGILDVGCYCVSMARLIAGAARGKAYEEPIEVQAAGRVGADSRVDEYTSALFKFPGDIIAQLSAAVQLNLDNTVRITGSAGMIHIPSPWVVMAGTAPSKIFLLQRGSQQKEIFITSRHSLYALEADNVAAHLAHGESPSMPVRDTLGNMKALDRWRAAIGLKYDFEQPSPAPAA